MVSGSDVLLLQIWMGVKIFLEWCIYVMCYCVNGVVVVQKIFFVLNIFDLYDVGNDRCK